MRRNIIKKGFISFTFEKAPRISLSCKLVPVQYRGYEYGLLLDSLFPPDFLWWNIQAISGDMEMITLPFFSVIDERVAQVNPHNTLSAGIPMDRTAVMQKWICKERS